jgi:transposase
LGALGAFFRRLKTRLGASKAITATAHKLARLIYRMLKCGTDYVDQGQEYYERRYQTRVLSTLSRRAHALRYTLLKMPDQAPAPSDA